MTSARSALRNARMGSRPHIAALQVVTRHLAAGRRLAIKSALACLAFASSAAFAVAGGGDPTPSDSPTGDLDPPAPPTSLWTRPTLFGDIGGLRPWLGKYGVTLQATETSEYLANLRGGLKTGGAYDGVTTLSLGIDTQKAIGIPGGTFNVSALQIHGSNLSQNKLGTLNTASGIEAQDSTRLWELWYQQALLDTRVDIRIGQQSIDQEFMVSQYAGTFIGTMFGWPGLPSYDMPSGGPAYPLAALGARVRAHVTPSLTALAGIYDGDPLGNDADNRSGTNFNTHNGVLYIGELQYAVNQGATGTAPDGLPGTYRIGAWYNNGRFDDQQTNAGGTPRSHHGDYSVYAVADQMIWRPDPDAARSIGVFARVMGAPGDRNLVGISANAGVVMKAPFEGRDDDSAGIGISYIKVGNHVHDLDLENRMLRGGPYGVRTSETALEATYQYQVAPWWIVQGDLQYTFNAGAGQNPDAPSEPLRNTFVIGVRTNITF